MNSACAMHSPETWHILRNAYMCITDTNEGSLHLPSLRQHTESMFHTLCASFHTFTAPRT